MNKYQNLDEIIKKVSEDAGLPEAAVRNLLYFQADNFISTRIGITFAELDGVLSGEENFSVAELFGLTQADLGNLIDSYGKEIVLGMLLAKLTLKTNK